MQVDAEESHRQERCRQHERDGQRDHEPGARAQRQERHHQHDRHRFEQGAHELADRILHHGGLVRDLLEFDAQGQSGLETRHRELEIGPQLQDIAGCDHRHRKADRGLAAGAHGGDRRVHVTAGDGGDIPQPESLPAVLSHHAQQQLRDRLDRIELPADAQRHRVLLGLDAAGTDDRILYLQRLADGARVDPEAGQLLGRQFDKDLVLLHADEFDLGHVRQAQQLLAHPLDVVAQLRVREPVGRERIDGPEHVAEFIVEERAQRLGGEGLADVADLFPDLVPDVGHILRRGRVEQLEDDQRLAGLGVAARPLEVGRLLQLLLDPIGDLLVHLLGGGAGPQRADHHAAKGKVRVLALAELEKCSDPADRDHDDEKERQFTILERRA